MSGSGMAHRFPTPAKPKASPRRKPRRAAQGLPHLRPWRAQPAGSVLALLLNLSFFFFFAQEKRAASPEIRRCQTTIEVGGSGPPGVATTASRSERGFCAPRAGRIGVRTTTTPRGCCSEITEIPSTTTWIAHFSTASRGRAVHNSPPSIPASIQPRQSVLVSKTGGQQTSP